MSKPKPPDEPSEELSRFQKLARALFHVDKRDVTKHTPTKRQPPSGKVSAK